MARAKNKQVKSGAQQGSRKRASKRRLAERTQEEKTVAREVSVDLGPIEPGVADVLALIDREKRRKPVEREVEPEDERGRGGAAARRGRGGRRDERTPQQPGRGAKGKTKQP
ncbi:MAG: hypothetical protein M9894_06570 [Planctomycetes bacterium]|nr:hypothetical protein [Planctomycetota bacterium]